MLIMENFFIKDISSLLLFSLKKKSIILCNQPYDLSIKTFKDSLSFSIKNVLKNILLNYTVLLFYISKVFLYFSPFLFYFFFFAIDLSLF